MKSVILIALMTLTLLAGACSRSKDPQFHILRPLPVQKTSAALSHLFIGIDGVNIPGFLEKNEFPVYETPHTLRMAEYDLWAESLNKNIPGVIRMNLSRLLPGAVVQLAPYDSKFKPTYQLQIYINQMTVDIRGNSMMEAEYLVYRDQEIVRKKTVLYRGIAKPATVDNMVVSMNHHINALSKDIAQSLRRR